MTNLTLSTIAAFFAFTVATAGLIATTANPGPMTVSATGLGGLELSPLSQSLVASNDERAY